MNPIAIIGGGVIGLSIGWQLTRLGAVVALFEKGTAGSEASSAAAGMITPASEVRFGEEDLLKLFLESLNSYPVFIEELEKQSGLSTDFRTDGSLMVALDHDDEAELNRLHEYQKELGLSVEMISPAEVTALEPLLSGQCTAAIRADSEYFLDNLRLIESLKKAFLASGGQLHEGTRIERLEIEQGKVRAIKAKGERFPVSTVCLATGIHQDIEGLGDYLSLPVRPVKGQALELVNNQTIPLTRAIRTIHRYPVYLVPRSDGRIVVGATNEEMGLDHRVTGGALLDLLYGAWKILPATAEMEVRKTWVGFRPTAEDHCPILGRTGIEGLFVAMGMYRHGILLTPIVGKLMAELMVQEKESKFFDVFGTRRFQN
ncbi:MAG: glycine oxidase ThiO [Deltaproteobacteria bacterium]|nr:glycine oxidase ThiO [Deltaproteobacteria bacterium]